MRIGIFFLILTLVSFSATAQVSKKGKKYNYYVTIKDGSFTNSKPEQGASLKGIWNDGQMIELNAWYGFNYGDIQRNFFFWNDELITVTEVHRLYNPKDPNLNLDSIPSCFNAQYVFEKGELINIKQTGTYSFAEGPQDRKSMQDMYINFARNYSALIHEKAESKRNRKKIKPSKNNLN